MSEKPLSFRDAPKVPILEDHTGHHTWSFKMKIALKVMGLWHVVEGAPETDEHKKSLALHMIQLHLGDQFGTLAEEATTAKGLWDKLQTRIRGTSDRYLVTLKAEFRDFGYKSEDTPHTYIDRAKRLLVKLTEQGDRTTESQMVDQAIRRLPAMYTVLKQSHMYASSVDNLDNLLLKLNDAHDALASEAKTDPFAFMTNFVSRDDADELKALIVTAS